ncbi:hypothetical protein CA51_46960 [Rosistilla oblonga]|nr:hypothetical protein CA51_46960 [Rosistilla oblonga]
MSGKSLAQPKLAASPLRLTSFAQLPTAGDHLVVAVLPESGFFGVSVHCNLFIIPAYLFATRTPCPRVDQFRHAR